MAIPSTDSSHIVVLGAGFAGLTFCRKFASRKGRVTLVDRQNHHLFQPLLYQVAAAGLAAPDIAQPVRAILRNHPGIQVLMADVTQIDLNARKVIHDRGELTYDYLVIAMGGQTSYFGHDDWKPHAPGLKSLNDALRIRDRILMAYECAESESNEARRRELMTTVVVGGGPTGVELAGTFAELSRRVLRHDFDHINPASARVMLVERGDRVLDSFPPDLSESARRQLQELGVEVRTGTAVEAIRRGEVDLNGETVRAANIIWAAGVGAVPITRTLGVETDRGGRLKVRPDLSLPGHPEVFAAGDLVALTDPNGTQVPGVAQGAMQMGEYLCRLISARLDDPGAARDIPPFVYRDKGSMATIGRSAAVAQIGKLKFSGWPAWAAWLTVHLVFLLGFHNKLSVLMSWMYSYFTYKRGARIITQPPKGPDGGCVV